MSVSIELAAEMIVMGGRADSLVQARAVCRQTIADGSALERFRRLVKSRGVIPVLSTIRRSCRLRGGGSSERSGRPVLFISWPVARSVTRPCCWERAGHAWTAPWITPSA